MPFRQGLILPIAATAALILLGCSIIDSDPGAATNPGSTGNGPASQVADGNGPVSQVETGNGTDNETVRARPDRPDPPDDRSDICNRTPEIQTAMLSELKSTSCQQTQAPELYRIRQLDVRTEYINNRDLSGLHNLQHLQLTLVDPPPDKAFQDLHSLETLTVNFNSDEHEKPIPWPIGKNTLQGLPSLESLTITDLSMNRRQTEQPVVRLEKNAFKPSENLRMLRMLAGNIHADPESLHGLTRLTDLEMQAEGRTGPFNETGTPTRIPPARLHLGADAFKTLSASGGWNWAPAVISRDPSTWPAARNSAYCSCKDSPRQ